MTRPTCPADRETHRDAVARRIVTTLLLVAILASVPTMETREEILESFVRERRANLERRGRVTGLATLVDLSEVWILVAGAARRVEWFEGDRGSTARRKRARLSGVTLLARSHLMFAGQRQLRSVV